MITAEYATGAIRPSLVAVPQRHAFLLAKVVTTVTTGLVAGALLVGALYGVTQAVIGDRPIGASLSSAVGELLAMTAMLTVVTLVGLGLGTLTRSTAGGSSSSQVSCTPCRCWGTSSRSRGESG